MSDARRNPQCSSCRAGEVERDADGLYVGRVFDCSESGRPFKGWLCEDHYGMLCDDGATLRCVKSVTPTN